jgi:hypothetical protein
MPTRETEAAARRGEVELGGCFIGRPGGDPAWRCRACRHEFGLMGGERLGEEEQMTIPVKIELGGYVLFAQMHAVPRVGEGLRTSFPAAGIHELLHLVVTSVTHHQEGKPEGREDNVPFAILVGVEGDPDPQLKELNDAVFERLGMGKRDA